MSDKMLLNIVEVPIRWTDQDAYGHLNNSKFFDCMTEARAEFLGEILKTPNICQFVIVGVDCQFKKPYFHPDTIIIKQFGSGVSASSFSLVYEFYSKNDPDHLYALGSAKMVAFDPKKRRATKLPDIVKEKLQQR